MFSFNDSDDYEDHEYPTMAEALRLTKNDPSISNIGQRKLVFFIGDPAMRLAFAQPNIRLTKINDVPIEDETDTLEALSYVKLSGEVTDLTGNVLTDYNGILSTTIYDKEIEEIEELEETLKWGEPSYLTKYGSTIRIAWKAKNPNQYAMYFKCTSKLVPTFKILYKNAFNFEGNRAIIFKFEDNIPPTELKKCIAAALTYHKVKQLQNLGM